MTQILDLFATVLKTHGLFGVLVLAGCVALAATAVIVLGVSIARAGRRTVRRWQLRRELRVLRGGRPAPIFTVYGELEERPRPPVRSLRGRRGDHDAA